MSTVHCHVRHFLLLAQRPVSSPCSSRSIYSHSRISPEAPQLLVLSRSFLHGRRCGSNSYFSRNWNLSDEYAPNLEPGPSTVHHVSNYNSFEFILIFIVDISSCRMKSNSVADCEISQGPSFGLTGLNTLFFFVGGFLICTWACTRSSVDTWKRNLPQWELTF